MFLIYPILSSFFLALTVGGADDVHLIDPLGPQLFSGLQETWHVAFGAARSKLRVFRNESMYEYMQTARARDDSTGVYHSAAYQSPPPPSPLSLRA